MTVGRVWVQVILYYIVNLRPAWATWDQISTLTPLLPHLLSLRKKQISQRRKTKSQSIRIIIRKSLQKFIIVITPQITPYKIGKYIQKKQPCLLLIANNYACFCSASFTFSTTLKYFSYWETWHRELGLWRKAFPYQQRCMLDIQSFWGQLLQLVNVVVSEILRNRGQVYEKVNSNEYDLDIKTKTTGHFLPLTTLNYNL